MRVAVSVVLLALCAVAAPPFNPPKFNCTIPSHVPPSNDVRKLLPGNIKVVMAMGDSITAGFAMKGEPPANLVEFRGDDFACGGDEGAITLPNFFKHYNKDITGYATGDSIPLTKGKALNAAVSGDIVQGLHNQVLYLYNTLKKDYPHVDIQKDWKLLTVWIGANNACAGCGNNTRDSQATYTSVLRDALNLTMTLMPRTFVNLMTFFPISEVYNTGLTKPYCYDFIFKRWPGECGCMMKGPAARAAIDAHARMYNAACEQIADEFQAMKNPNFTVVVQPQFEGINITASGEAFLSKLDCFHPSLYANWGFTYGVFGNMFVPKAQKVTALSLAEVYMPCPAPDQYLWSA